jgi:hypothetical protein
VSRISSIRTLPNASTRTSNDCATPSLTTLGLQHSLGFFVSCMCASCSTPHGVKWLMIFLFACPQVLLMTSVPCYVSTSGNLFTTSLTTDKICMMMTRLACNRAIESSYWRMDNDSDVGLLTGYVLYRLLVELEFMELDTFPRWFRLHPSLLTSW